MPRHRKIEIKASELACFDTLVEELRSRPEFADFDPASLRVWAYEDYEPTIRHAARYPSFRLLAGGASKRNVPHDIFGQ